MRLLRGSALISSNPNHRLHRTYNQLGIESLTAQKAQSNATEHLRNQHQHQHLDNQERFNHWPSKVL